MRQVTILVIAACWAILAAAFSITHLRVSRRRKTTGERNRVVAGYSMAGLAMEAAAYFLAFAWPDKHPRSDTASLYLAAVLASASTAMVMSAIRHLGQQWRIQAVVTDEHRLVASGPYALVRHPIYSALLGMLIATSVLVSGWTPTVVASVVYLAGTEIRVRAEDGLLAARFGPEFDVYRRSVKAYIPFVR